MKYWEIIADNLKKAGWSWDCVSALDLEGRTIWIVDAHRQRNFTRQILPVYRSTTSIRYHTIVPGGIAAQLPD